MAGVEVGFRSCRRGRSAGSWPCCRKHRPKARDVARLQTFGRKRRTKQLAAHLAKVEGLL